MNRQDLRERRCVHENSSGEIPRIPRRYCNYIRVLGADDLSEAELERVAIKCLSLSCEDEAHEAQLQLQKGTLQWRSPRKQERLREDGQVAIPISP